MIGKFLTDLSVALSSDAGLCLLATVAWLDPLAVLQVDWEDEEDLLGNVLWVTRNAMPEVYAGLVGRLQAGASYDELERFACAEISALGIPVENLEFLSWGIPLPAYGINLNDPDVYEYHPDIVPILEAFGMSDFEVDEDIYQFGRFIVESLESESEWQSVRWALAFLFGFSGNSLLDNDAEMLDEHAPLGWDKSDVDFAIELIQEAHELLEQVNLGMERLKNPLVLASLRENIERIRRGTNERLEWASSSGEADGEAVTGLELLQLRGDVEEAGGRESQRIPG